MKPALREMIEEFDSRAVTTQDQQQIFAYADSMAARLACVAEVEKLEQKSLVAAMKTARAQYPNAEQKHGLCWAKAIRDMQLVLRECINGVLLDDVDFVDTRILIWLRTILKSYNFEGTLIPDCYRFLKTELEKVMTPESFVLLAPFLDRTVARLAGDLDPN